VNTVITAFSAFHLHLAPLNQPSAALNSASAALFVDERLSELVLMGQPWFREH